MLDYIALGTVFHTEMTGYDIKKEIEIGVGNYYKASYGSLYPALEKLATKGYLTMTETAQGKRIKKYYQITDEGRVAFLEWLALPADFSAGSLKLMTAKIYFYGELPADIRQKRLQEFEFFAQQRLQTLRKLEKSHTTSEYSDRDYFEMATLYLGIQNVITNIRWVQHIQEHKTLSAFIQEIGGQANEKS